MTTASNVILMVVILCCLTIAVTSDTRCTSIRNNTCIINKTHEWQPQNGNIVCNASFPSCIVLCQHVLSCSDNINGKRVAIICPPHAESCIINCTGSRSCRSTRIIADTSHYTEINIKANNAGRDMRIYAAYKLQINVIGSDADFLESKIYSQSLTTHININCNRGEMCTDNKIYGSKATESLTLSCNGLFADCSNTNIRCPTNASSTSCNVSCSMCQNMNVYASEGTSNIHWHCGGPYACDGSTLICAGNQDDLIWNHYDEQWEFEQNLCRQPHTTTNSTKWNTVFVPKSNQSVIILSTMEAVIDDVMENISKYSGPTSAANHVNVIIILVSCTVSSVVLFWCCVEWIKRRYYNKRTEGQYEDEEYGRTTSVGAPPPRTDKTGNKSHVAYLIRIPREESNSETSVRTHHSIGNSESPRYNHMRVRNVLTPSECIDVDDSILCDHEGTQANQAPEDTEIINIEEDDDFKCGEVETGALTTDNINVAAEETLPGDSTTDDFDVTVATPAYTL